MVRIIIMKITQNLLIISLAFALFSCGPGLNKGSNAKLEQPVIFYSDRNGRNDIYLMNGDGTGIKRLTDNKQQNYNQNWSPDGKKIAFSSFINNNYDIYVMNADGTDQKKLTDNPAHDDHHSWSPDGKKIAFQSIRDGNYEIYVMNADGTDQKRLTKSPAADEFPIWSPDGKKIAYHSYHKLKLLSFHGKIPDNPAIKNTIPF
jgi:Tol biopolymer transport system component